MSEGSPSDPQGTIREGSTRIAPADPTADPTACSSLQAAAAGNVDPRRADQGALVLRLDGDAPDALAGLVRVHGEYLRPDLKLGASRVERRQLPWRRCERLTRECAPHKDLGPPAAVDRSHDGHLGRVEGEVGERSAQAGQRTQDRGSVQREACRRPSVGPDKLNHGTLVQQRLHGVRLGRLGRAVEESGGGGRHRWQRRVDGGDGGGCTPEEFEA
eukprot:CAMPEP_0181253536 /NCGR_PEP_ID=MMETSP1096-20121128/48062_1 /TAXON_ID=156174 ORGANISM="Chrysochromulina ericina, Strain CCMP281" /NCGR_SAMPLE_ID=MMETSP1096 /ASSEMBLY_ACC=CAM_ASM_000453 /LENGTH=215 /DNA_ID=CAMNT_0023351391 /DNA_START=337 /DNA_END=982 /DNA_ORIENTATION=+